MSIEDPNDFRGQRIRQVEKVREELSEEKAEEILEYVDKETKKNELAESTLKNRISKLRILSESTDKQLLEMTSTEVNDLIQSEKQSRNWSNEYVRNYQKAVRRFYEIHGEEKKQNRIILTSSKSEGEKKIKPEDLLTDRELGELFEKECRNDRDRALFMTMYETGARLSAIVSRKIKDYEYQGGPDTTSTLYFGESRGLKGFEGHRLITQADTFIQDYLTHEHPDPENEEAPLFTVNEGNYEEGEDNFLRPEIVRRRLKRITEDTDIHVTPHILRHCRVTEMRKQGYSDALIKHQFGWSENTTQIERYSHLEDEEKNKKIAEQMGLDVDDEDYTPELSECPRCGYPIGKPDWENCPRCQKRLGLYTYPQWLDDYVDAIPEDASEDKIYDYILDNPIIIGDKDEVSDDDGPNMGIPLYEAILSKLRYLWKENRIDEEDLGVWQDKVTSDRRNLEAEEVKQRYDEALSKLLE